MTVATPIKAARRLNPFMVGVFAGLGIVLMKRPQLFLWALVFAGIIAVIFFDAFMYTLFAVLFYWVASKVKKRAKASKGTR